MEAASDARRGLKAMAVHATLRRAVPAMLVLIAACAPHVAEAPLTAAEKEAIIRTLSTKKLEADAQVGVRPSCAASTRLVRYRARVSQESGAEGFASRGCPAGSD